MAEAIPFWGPEVADAQGLTPWDKLSLGGELLPGLVRMKCGTSHDFDVKKAKGKSKAKPKDSGDQPSKPEFDWVVWKPEHWVEAMRLLPLLSPDKPGAAKSPLAAVNPRLALHGITTVLVTSIDGPEIDKGVGTFRVKLLEVAQPKAQDALSLGKGGKSKEVQSHLVRTIEQMKQDETSLLAVNDPVGAGQVAVQRRALEAQLEKPSAEGGTDNF